MDDILASAHTWFLESYQQGPYGDLVIRLAEGIKGSERLPVHVAGQVLGPYFPVTVAPHSRCATVTFRNVRSLLTYTEGFDSHDSKMQVEDGRFLRKVNSSSFREFTAATSTAIDEFRGGYSEWVLWTEDQIFQVLSGEPPEVSLQAHAPDFSIERGGTWSAS